MTWQRPEHKRKQRYESSLRFRRVHHPFPPTLAIRVAAILALSSAFMATTGCNFGESPSPTVTKVARVLPERIVAQGQLLPANGLIRLAATPGDTVDDVQVKVGDRVKTGQPLVVMRSLKIRQSQLESLDRRYEDAKQQQLAAVEQAELRVKSAELKVSQAEAQIQSLARQGSIVDLAKSQVNASENVLRRLETIAGEPLTKDFVGSLELDRQRMVVTEAELKLRQQAEALSQAQESADWLKTAANQELTAARTALRLAQESSALEAIEAERTTLQLQIDASTIVAPRDAIVVAVNTQKGESASQYPLVELAETEQVICAVEVVEADASLIAQGQAAKISSPALPRELLGTVVRRDHLVGRPQLPSADPLAKADYRTANVIVEIQAADAAIASTWLQLQVKAEIDVTTAVQSEAPADGAARAP